MLVLVVALNVLFSSWYSAVFQFKDENNVDKAQLLLLPCQQGGWCAQGFGSRHKPGQQTPDDQGISHTIWNNKTAGSWPRKGTGHSLGTGWASISGGWATVLRVTCLVYPFIIIFSSFSVLLNCLYLFSGFLPHPMGGVSEQLHARYYR